MKTKNELKDEIIRIQKRKTSIPSITGNAACRVIEVRDDVIYFMREGKDKKERIVYDNLYNYYCAIVTERVAINTSVAKAYISGRVQTPAASILLVIIKKEAALINGSMQTLWTDEQKGRHCPHCNNLLWIQENYATIICPMCNMESDVPSASISNKTILSGIAGIAALLLIILSYCTTNNDPPNGVDEYMLGDRRERYYYENGVGKKKVTDYYDGRREVTEYLSEDEIRKRLPD
jgi:hypothetical protein